MTIQHVALPTRRDDVAAEEAFWGLLGFAPVAPPASLVERAVWLQSGSTQVHLLLDVSPGTSPAGGHVAVVCPAYAETQAALRGAGFDVDERTAHWGAPRCYTSSPSGHRVEVMAAPPA